MFPKLLVLLFIALELLGFHFVHASPIPGNTASGIASKVPKTAAVVPKPNPIAAPAAARLPATPGPAAQGRPEQHTADKLNSQYFDDKISYPAGKTPLLYTGGTRQNAAAFVDKNPAHVTVDQVLPKKYQQPEPGTKPDPNSKMQDIWKNEADTKKVNQAFSQSFAQAAVKHGSGEAKVMAPEPYSIDKHPDSIFNTHERPELEKGKVGITMINPEGKNPQPLPPKNEEHKPEGAKPEETKHDAAEKPKA